LHYAALNGDQRELIALLDAGASADAQDDNGWTALHFAAQDHHPAIVESLLQRGANPNLLNSHGNGPLWVALMRSRDDLAIIKMLIAAGANPDQKNASGRSPRDMAFTIKGGLEELFS
jgi:ankyrin repeat protein